MNEPALTIIAEAGLTRIKEISAHLKAHQIDSKVLPPSSQCRTG